MESADGHANLKTFLTADDLFKLRKPGDIPSIEHITEKGYIPQDSDNYHVASLLKDKKNILETKNVSRIADLIQAEWKPEINKAVTTKLRGRTQHMGCSLDGKVGLCPEEIIYLLESGNLELTYNAIPLSVESAYSTVLAEDLAVEKYQVYAFLSRLGYIVVQHQKHIDVSQQERLHAQNKCRCKKKRKQKGPIKPNKKIHLETDNSSSSSHVEINSDKVSKTNELLVQTSEHIEKTQDSCNTDSNSATTNALSSHVENSLPNSAVSTDELDGDKVTLVTTEENNFALNDHNEKTVKDKDELETAKSKDTSENLEEYLPLSVSPAIVENKVCDEAQKNLKDTSSSTSTLKTTETTVDNNGDQNQKSPLSTSLVEENKLLSKTQSESAESGQSSVACDKIKKDDESVATSENNISKIMQEVTRKTSSDNYIQLDDDESNKSVRDLEYAVASKLKSDDEQTSDSDVLSIYADSNDDEMCEVVNDDSVQSVADNEVAEADDVMVLEVNKHEAEPLAVIDLSSDEENNSVEINPAANDDDEVLIISECRSTKPLRSQGWFNSSFNTKLKKEVVAKSEINVCTGPSFPFPNLFKKRVICLPRPPSYLLPFNLCMNKEAYTVDLSKITAPNTFTPPARVWNSWRDLQERRNMQNSPGLNNENRREFPPFSAPMNINPFPYHTPPTNQYLSFPNNITPPNMNRFGGPQFEMNISSNSFQVSPQPFDDTPMCGLRSLNAPIINRPPNNYNMEDSKRDLFQQSMNLQIFNSPNNENCPVNPWANSSFNERPNSRQNLIPNENRDFPSQWRNIPPGESCRPFNIQSNSPHMEEFRSSPTPWGNMDCNPSRQFSGPGDFPQNRNFLLDHPQRNFQNPWMDQAPFNHEQNNVWNRPPDGHWRPIQDAYPCDIPRLPRSGAANWRQLKTANPEADLETSNNDNQDDSEIQEVAIDIDEILWSKEIRPLVRPSPSLTLDEAFKCIQKTTANLFTSTKLREKSLPEVCSIEISFDVYLPKTSYRRSCPAVPSHRIIVTRSSDSFPRLSDIYALTRKFKDSAILQFAVVDNGDIAFYSFNNAYVPMLLP